MHGFVVRYMKAIDEQQPPVLDVCQDDRIGLAAGRRFRLLVRPLPTTPEAEAERQPYVFGHTVAVYQGRIDNRREIIDRIGDSLLEQVGDSELIARAYSKWGANFPAIVLGEYSFALINQHTEQLIAGRDSLGIGHLFQYQDTSAVWVASNLEILLAALPSRPSFDRSALAEYIATGGLLVSGRTIYTGIDEVPAAHVLVQSGAAVTVTRYWEPVPESQARLRGPDEYDEEFRSILSAAVKAALRSNTPVWSDLSGGLDSSTVTALAASLDCSGNDGITAFSMSASMTALSNESPFQDDFIARYPIQQHRLDIDDYLSFGTPEPPSCHPSKAIIYRPIRQATAELFAQHGAQTHLTGRGGDNIFCGDEFPPRYLAGLLRGLKLRQWIREINDWARQGKRSLWNLVWHCSRSSLTDLYAGEADRGIVPTWLIAPFRDQVTQIDEGQWTSGYRLYSDPGRELQYRSIQMTSRVVRFMPVGDERHPLLYRPLVEFVLDLPWEHLLRPDENRIIQRRALRNVLPESIRLRTSKTSATPVFLRGLRRHWTTVRHYTEGRRLAELDILDPIPFHAACERLRHGLLAKQFRYLVGALTLEIWLEANSNPVRDQATAGFFAADHSIGQMKCMN